MFSRTRIQFILLSLFIFALVQSKSGAQAMRQEKKKRHLLGGYSHTDTDSLEVIQASKFVVESIRKDTTVGQKFTFELPASSEGELKVKVLDAAKQVVAGVNLKMVIAMYAGEQCIGGLSAVVFRDLQGSYHVKTYGKELSCSFIKEKYGNGEEEDE